MEEVRSWIQNELTQIPKMQVIQEPFNYIIGNLSNIIGILPGTVNREKWVIIGAHFDSIARGSQTAAPGAEDNASGVASVLELANAISSGLSTISCTVIFALFDGKEEGNLGSIGYLQNLKNHYNYANITFAHIMDMVSFQSPKLDEEVLLESSSTFQSFFSAFEESASRYSPRLKVVKSVNPFGSDHMTFIVK